MTAEPTEWPSEWQFVHAGMQLLIGGYPWICVKREGNGYVMRNLINDKTQTGHPKFDGKVTVIAPGHKRYVKQPGDNEILLPEQVMLLLHATIIEERHG